MRKGILLAGGAGTRLLPVTRAVSKQLLPVYDKPMVFYPLWTLRACGVEEILVITTPQHAPLFRDTLGTGDDFGCKLSYVTQARPGGIAESLLIAEPWLRGSSSVLALGDNILYGHGLGDQFGQIGQFTTDSPIIFGYPMADPRSYGVVQMHPTAPFVALDIEEKPKNPRSNLAVPGLYFLPADAPKVAGQIPRSARGELEITDVLRHYIHQEPKRGVAVNEFKAGVAWFDCGTFDGLLEAAEFVAAVTRRQGINVCDPREFVGLSPGRKAG